MLGEIPQLFKELLGNPLQLLLETFFQISRPLDSLEEISETIIRINAALQQFSKNVLKFLKFFFFSKITYGQTFRIATIIHREFLWCR